MSKYKNIKGIVYRVFSSKDADKIAYVLDTNGSKQAISVKGGRKPLSKKAGTVEIGNLIETKAVDGYSVLIATEIRVINEFSSWKNDYKSIIILQFLCEIIDKFAQLESDETYIYNDFITVLGSFEKSVFASAIFLERLLLNTGNLPKLNECVETGKELFPGKIFTSKDFAGYTSKETSPIFEFNERIFKTQRFIEHHGINESLAINLAPDEQKNMLKLHVSWIELVLERELKSKQILFSVI